MNTPHDDMTGGDPRLDALFAELGAPDPIDPEISRSQIAAAAAAVEDGPSPVAAGGWRRRWYGRLVTRASGLGLTAKMLLGTAVAVAATGGAAAGGVLPDPIQSFVADTASAVGFDLPNPRLETTTTTTTAPDETATSTTSTTAADSDGEAPDPAAQPVAGAWQGVGCGAEPFAIRYTVQPDGTLTLDSIVGATTDVDTDDDRIRVDFDGVSVDIRLDDEVTVEVDTDCDSGDDDDSEEPDTDDPDATDDDPTDTTEDSDDPDDSDDSDDSDDDTTSTTEDSEEPDTDDPDTDDPDTDEPDSDDTEEPIDDETTHPAAGTDTWMSTTCGGAPISVTYSVSMSGELSLVSASGGGVVVDAGPDRLRIEFGSDIEVEIRTTSDAITVDEDRSC